MGQPQYDMQAHGEQIRHAQYDADAAFEFRQDEAAATAHIALAEMDGSELLDMIANDPALECRMVLLIERIAMLGVAGTAVDSYKDDVMRAAKDLQSAMVGLLSEQRVKAVTR